MVRRFCLLLLLSLICMGANRHVGTTAHPETGVLKIEWEDSSREPLSIRLNAKGVSITKRSDQTIERIHVSKGEKSFLIVFYKQKGEKKERPLFIQHFRQFGRRLLIHGMAETFHPNGMLFSQTNWYKGQLDGAHKKFNQRGELIEEKYYYEGLPVKTWRKYQRGEKRHEIVFPENKIAWKKTVSPSGSVAPLESKIILSPYYHPIPITETWYYDNGKKEKEVHYLAHWQGYRFVIWKTGEEKQYNRAGKLISEKKRGKGKLELHHTLFFQTAGLPFYQKHIEFGDQFFRRTGNTLISFNEGIAYSLKST